MVTWQWIYGPWAGTPQSDIGPATSRTVTWRTTGRHEASYTIDGRQAEAAGLQELVSDLRVIRDGRCLYRGRLGPTDDEIDTDSYALTASWADYRAVLDRRQLWENDILSYAGVDQAKIAWGLLSSTQARDGGELHIIRGVGATTGVGRAGINYEIASKVGEQIDALSVLQHGFDWDITPNQDPSTPTQTLDIWSPYRGAQRGVVLDFGGLVATVSRQFDPSTYANAVRFSGDDSLLPLHLEATDIATRPEGRWETDASDTTLLQLDDLTAAGNQSLTTAEIPTPSYSLTLVGGRWHGPDHIWLGDSVFVRIPVGRLNVAALYRVAEIQAAWSDDTDGVPTVNGVAVDPRTVGADGVVVTLVVGAIPPDRKWRARAIDQRISALERR